MSDVVAMNKSIADLVMAQYKVAVQEVIRISAENAAADETSRLEKEFEERQGYGLGNKFADSEAPLRRRNRLLDAQNKQTYWEAVVRHVLYTFCDKEAAA
jgi:hypothetical protein